MSADDCGLTVSRSWQTLIATNVLSEGIDVPDCSVVTVYDDLKVIMPSRRFFQQLITRLNQPYLV